MHVVKHMHTQAGMFLICENSEQNYVLHYINWFICSEH
jgi:hypothetical protein